MSFSIRPMHAEDLPTVHAVQLSTFAPELHEEIELFVRIFKTSPESCFVGENSGGAMGGYLLSYPSRTDRDDFENGPRSLAGTEDALYIHDLCVGPALQGAGFGKALLGKARAFAESRNMKRLCGIAVGNAAPFWERQGFNMKRKCTYHDTPAIWMTLELTRA